MIAFARTCDAIAQTPGTLAKIAAVADYLRSLSADDLTAAARFFTGNPFAQGSERTLAIGGRTIIAAARSAWGMSDEALGIAYRATGDLGAALGPFARPAHDLGLFRETLTPASLMRMLDEIADAAGKHAKRRRAILCERIFGACTDSLEATYVVKILTGELRIGLREGLIVDAIATAFARDPVAVRRAASAAGDIGAVAVAAQRDELDEIEIGYLRPIAFMLASPIPYGASYVQIGDGEWLVEDKYDGIRIQAHVTPERIALFTRALNDVAASYPDVVAALQNLSGRAILDGELIAERDGRVQPFRVLQARLQRKALTDADIAEVPVRFVPFDLLARDERFLLDEPLATRRGELAELGLESAPWTALERGAEPSSINAAFDAARERGHEGLVFKRTDAPYHPGRRGKWWLKLKRELSTLDCVVVGVEWGHGRRAQLLSDYTFAVRSGDELVTIGKAYSGLTDVEIATMTEWFQVHRLPADDAQAAYSALQLGRREIMVEPSIVVEIAFDIIQPSELHASGFSLRFPRIVRLRDDKAASDADTIERVREIYAEMLSRESGSPAPPDGSFSGGA